MPNSYVEYSSGLTETTYSIPFNYIAIDDVAVKGFDGSNWSDLTVASRDASAKTVTLDTAPSAYQKIRVWRNTSTAQLVDFQNGSRLSERDLDTAYQQGLFVAQEVSEGASTVTAEGTSNISLSGTTTVSDLDVTGDLEVTGNLKVDTIQDTTGTSAMTIDSDGNVGIGTSSPTSVLDVRRGDTDGKIAEFHQSTGYGLDVSSSDSVAKITSGYNQAFAFETGTTPTERMRIDTNGNLMVGTTLADDFEVSGHRFNVGDTAYAQFVRTANDGTANIYIARGSDGRVLSFYRNDGGITQTGNVSVTASATSYNTSSDYRLKENVVDITDGITRVKQLEPKKFNFIADAETTVDGFIAHEAQAVVPESVTGTKDEVDDEGNPVMQGIDQAKLVPLLTAALKEAIAKIEALETRVEALENA